MRVVSHRRARRLPVGALALALLASGACQGGKAGHSDEKQAEPTPAEPSSDDQAPLRDSPTSLDLGSGPIRNPLNLYDIGIAGAPAPSTVGKIDQVVVTVQDLESRSVGAFSRISERLYAAEDDGYRWLVEHTALTRQAEKAGQELLPFLQAQFDQLPSPTMAELDELLAGLPLADMPEAERVRAARSLWRIERWTQRRHELVLAGRTGLKFERLRRRISTPDYADPATVVARIGDRDITRDELRRLSGYKAEMARREYYRILKMQFDEYVDEFLLTREADHLSITVDALLAHEAESMPVADKAAVDKYLKDNPEYAKDPQGRERARDNLRRLREIDAKANLLKRLHEESQIVFFLKEPQFAAYPIEVPWPRFHGPADAPHTVIAFHSLGCDRCTRGARLLLTILEAGKGQYRLEAGDYFEDGQLGAYRGALALRCAPDAKRDDLLRALAASFGHGQIDELVDKATALGIDRESFLECLQADRYLPGILENIAMAKRLGLERNILGIFANGVRIGDLGDPAKVLDHLNTVFTGAAN